MELPATTKDITVEWLNEALHDNGFLENTEIISLKHEEIGVGEGYTGDIARIYLTYDNDSQQLPATIIAKLPTSFEPVRSVGLQLGIYARETQFYKDIAPSSPLRTPYCYYGGIDSTNDKYVLLLEDCSKYYQPDPELRGINYEEARAITLAIAEFHAHWWDDARLRNSSFLLQPNERMADEEHINSFRNTLETCSTAEDFKQSLPEGGLEACRQLQEKYHLIKEMLPRDKLTIIHTDLRADNVFMDPNDKDHPVIVYDWAMTSNWRGVADISRLLGTSVEVDLRRNIEKDLIQQYYNQLVESGVSDYSHEECWKDYLKGYPVFTMMMLAAFAIGDRSNVRGNKRAVQNVERWFSAIVDNDILSLLP
ncbi:MAG: DUF1679 domain-containing protein [Dehalococcoidales bacterium]|nr:DUF1679 domain-containing protein [Dehalococcoidales bacterium]